MNTESIVAILIATIPNLIMFLSSRGTSKASYENVSMQTIKEYANQVREMRKELAEIDKDRKNWQRLAEEYERKLEWATDYIDRLSHQIRSLGHEPVLAEGKKENKNG